VAKKALTAAAVEKLRPGAARVEVPDGGCSGLYLIIQRSGAKSWALRFRKSGGRSAKLTLGPVDQTNKEAAHDPAIGAPLTLASARRLAAQINHRRARGEDVVAARHLEKLERRERGAKTFDAAALDFVEQHAMRRTRTGRDRARLLGVKVTREGSAELIQRGLAHRWRDRPVADITGDDVHAVIDEARERGVPGLERRRRGPNEARALALYAALSKFFAWCVERRRLRVNPVAGVARPAGLAARDRVLKDDEVVAFWKASSDERKEFAALLKLLLLTGQRLGEVRGMRRAELGDDNATWTIPGERTKNRRTHVVPLPQLARGIIEETGDEGDLVFTTDGRHPVAIGSKIKRRIDKRMKTTPWRFHDLRRTCATGMAEIGVAPHVVEAVLNHVSGAKASVAGTYNRAAYAAEKKAALERWAAHVEGLVAGAKSAEVVPMRRKADG